jgi:beta-lactamase regulating signal transducer with metallopeptidase domain
MTDFFYALVSLSWHASLLIACAWLLCRLSRSRAAWVRHHIWLITLIAVVFLPIWSASANRMQFSPPKAADSLVSFVNLPQRIVAFQAAEQKLSAQVPPVKFSPPEESGNFDWLFYLSAFLSAFWLIGICAAAGKVFLESLRLRRLRRESREINFSELDCPQIDSLEIPTASFAISHEIRAPMLTGVFRPVILLPCDFAEWTTPEERRFIILHELAHLARRDHLAIVFQTLLGIVFFFHPLMRYALRQLCVEREQDCDERVVRSGVNPIQYSETLLKAASRSLSSPRGVTPAVAFITGNALQKRIEQITNPNRRGSAERNKLFFAFPVVLIICISFLLGCAGQISTGGEEREIRALLKKAAELEVSGKIEDFELLTAADFVRIGPRGEVEGKQETLVRRSETNRLQTVEMQNERIRIYGDTAVVTGLGIARGQTAGGESFVVRNFCTFVLVKRDNRWQFVSVQQTRAA